MLVHGLQGANDRTWLWEGPSRPSVGESSAASVATGGESFRSEVRCCSGLSPLLRPSLPLTTSKQPSEPSNSVPGAYPSSTQPHGQRPRHVLWPRDLLPLDFPQARILAFGYDSRVTKGFREQANKNNVFAHAQDLLCALAASRQTEGRPLIFIAHSLGGIIVKDVRTPATHSADD